MQTGTQPLSREKARRSLPECDTYGAVAQLVEPLCRWFKSNPPTISILSVTAAMKDHEKQAAIREMRYQEEIRNIEINRENYLMIANCRARIDEIMGKKLHHKGRSVWAIRTDRNESNSRLNDVLSGKNEPFVGASDYLQNVRKGK